MMTAVDKQIIHAGATVHVQVAAEDVDIPSNALTLSFTEAPAGASINADGGFSWSSSLADAGSSFSVVVRAGDDGNPPYGWLLTIRMEGISGPIAVVKNPTGPTPARCAAGITAFLRKSVVRCRC
jgi:hypothetical protein